MQKLLLAAMAAKQKQETAHSHELLDAHEKELALKAQLEDLRDDYARLLISKQKPLSQQDLYPRPEEESPDTGGASGSGGYSTLGPRPQRPPVGPSAHGVGTSFDLITPAASPGAPEGPPPVTHAAEITTEGYAERPGGDGAPQILRPARVRPPFRPKKRTTLG